MGHLQTTSNFLELPSLSGSLPSTIKLKQRPVHKLEKKEKGQLLSTLHGFLFKDLEVTDPSSSQSHLLMTDPALPSWKENISKMPPGYLVAVVPALPLMKCSSAISPLAIIKLSADTGKPQAKEAVVGAWWNVFSEMHGWPWASLLSGLNRKLLSLVLNLPKTFSYATNKLFQ